MIALLFSPIGKTVGGVLLGAALVGGIYTYGHSRGAAAERQAILERSIQAYQQREEIDNEVDAADLVDICIALGGLLDDCTDQLRGVEKTTESK